MKNSLSKSLLLITIGVIVTLNLFAKETFAHSGGIPFVKINGQDTKIYTKEEYASINGASIPSDIAPENFVINQTISFEVDPEKLSYPKEVTDQATYTWNFGDGQEVKGKKVEHSYSKMGSYAVNVQIDYGDLTRFDFYMGDSLPPTQSILVHILPDKEYKLPQPVVKINNQLPKIVTTASSAATNSATISRNNLEIDLNNRLTFDASDSKIGTTKIKKYQWDFGQGSEGTNKVDSYRYKLPQYYVTAILRVEDENGFFADTFVDIQNSGLNEENNPGAEELFKFLKVIGGAILVTIIIGIIGILLWKKTRKNKD